MRLGELQKKAGEYLASQLKCEAALVSAGAASALTLGTAACMTVANRAGVKLLPTDVQNLKNEVIVQKAHRYGYDHALKNCGIRFVEVETLAEYERAFTDDGNVPLLQRSGARGDKPRRLDPRRASE